MKGPVTKKMQSLITGFIFLAVFACGSPVPAYQPEEGNVNVTIGPYSYRTLYHSPTPALDSPSRGGYGIVATGDSNHKGSVELGIFYLDKLFFRDEGTDVLAESIQHVHITMGYRWWLLSWLSTSFTFFSAYPVGDPKIYYRHVSASYFDTSASDLTEYGFDGSIQAEVISLQKVGFVIEGLYSRSVTSKAHEAGDHYGIMVGMRFMIQEKRAKVTTEKSKELAPPKLN